MSKKPQKTSGGAENAPENHSVYDFLYNDSRRVGSYLSQFGVGHLQQLTQTKDAERGTQKGAETEGNVGVPGFAGGGYKNLQQTSLAATEGTIRVYDPLWTNARSFLDHLSENDLIQRDLEQAAIGQFVLVQGSLIISDLQMFQSVWKSDLIKKFVMQSIPDPEGEHDASAPLNRAQKRAGQAKARHVPAQPMPISEADLVLELLPYFPHSSQFHLVADEWAVWGSIEAESMVGSISDLMLKHGAKIPGVWSMLGILDGRPFEVDDLLTPLEMARVGMTVEENVSKIPLQLAPMIRQLLGRPLLSYGMTPLMVFREVA